MVPLPRRGLFGIVGCVPCVCGGGVHHDLAGKFNCRYYAQTNLSKFSKVKKTSIQYQTQYLVKILGDLKNSWFLLWGITVFYPINFIKRDKIGCADGFQFFWPLSGHERVKGTPALLGASLSEIATTNQYSLLVYFLSVHAVYVSVGKTLNVNVSCL